MIRDYNIEHLEKRVWIGAQEFQTWAGAIVGVGAGAPHLIEVSLFGFGGAPVPPADTVTHVMMTPYDLDRTKQVRFRVWWTQTSTTATDAATFILLYTSIVESDNVAGTLTTGTTLVDPATALDTVIPALDLSTGVAYQAQATGFGIINRNTFTDTSALLAISVELDAVTTFTDDEPVFLGLEMRYTPRITAGPRRNILGGRRLVAGYPLGVRLHATQEGL